MELFQSHFLSQNFPAFPLTEQMVGVQAQKATQMEKNKEQNSAKDAFSCSAFSGTSNSLGFQHRTSHGFKHLRWLSLCQRS